MLRTTLATLATLTLGLLPAALAASESVSLTTNGVTLAGTLELPEGNGPFPVVLIVAGSGPTDRDGNSALLPGKNDSLKLLAGGLAARGIASVRYDKRGVGASTAPGLQEADLRFDDYVNDAAAWLDMLGADTRFHSVGVVGHSEGSLIALVAAQKANVPKLRVGAVVSLEGAGENAADLILTQLRANHNNPPELVAEAQKIVAELRAGRTVAQVSPVLNSLFRPSVQPYLISWFAYDPARQIAALKVPVLIVQGESDLQTGVRDAQLLKAAQPAARRLLVPGMNHVLKEVGNDMALNQKAYSDPSLPLAPGLLHPVAEFLKANLK